MGLSEPRKKQRISVDPQNKQWANDTTKAGYAMLTKMGWTDGKGLGRNEDGDASHIKVVFKANNLGVGAKKGREVDDDGWRGQVGIFDDILKNLNSGNGDDTAEKADAEEEKTEKKTSKKRKAVADGDAEGSVESADPQSKVEELVNGRLAHRRKFLKNKNVAAYSEDDINKILGVKTTKSSPAESEAVKEVKKKLGENNVKIAAVSSDDYFAAKMRERLGAASASSDPLVKGLIQSARSVSERRTHDADENDDDLDERPSFGGLGLGASTPASQIAGLGSSFGAARPAKGFGFVKAQETTASTLEETAGGDKEKKRKKKKAEMVADEPGAAEDSPEEKPKKKKKNKSQDDSVVPEEAQADAKIAPPPKKRKKDKKTAEDVEAADEVPDASAEPESTSDKTQRDQEENGEYAAPKTAKKSKGKGKRDKWGR